MRIFTLIIVFFCFSSASLTAQIWAKKGLKTQKKLDAHYKDPATSPLPKGDIAEFSGHPFFEANKKFIVKATFESTPDAKPFQMPTSTDRLPIYTQYGIVTFSIEGKEYKLSIYQNQKYKTTLFLPFYDLTSGDTTYGGGRYLDLPYPKGNKLKIDFNMAYHPYCAYSDQYSCPIPPIENRMDVAILAGVQLLQKYVH